MHEHRNASNQLTFAFDEIPMSQYSKVTRQVVKEFDLAACGEKIKGLDELFQEFGRGSTLIALEWDNWSGFMVCAKSKESETLAGQIAAYVQNL